MPEMIYSSRFAAGETVFRMGDPGRNAYFIESGAVEVSVLRDGAEVVIAKLGVGEIFGEMSMIDDAPRSATVTATEDTEVIVIQRSRFLQPLKSANPMMNLLLRVVLARFRGAQNQLLGMRMKAGEIDTSLEEIRSLAFDRIHAERDMRRGLEAAEFEMHYQPIVALDGGHMGGFEALMRWRKADGSFISPGHFILLAEETGMIVELGRWALEVGLRDQLALARAFGKAFPGKPVPFMSINLSGMQLSELAEIDRLAAIIDKSGVDPAAVKLEITETLMVENPDHAADALKKLKELGVLIAIDDFGTGYSSLSYLHQFPLDTLKIDRVFVNNMDKSENSRRIVHSIVGLALALGMDIVAEGIEEKPQMEALKELGCQYGQGFHMSKPLPLDEALALIDAATVWS